MSNREQYNEMVEGTGNPINYLWKAMYELGWSAIAVGSTEIRWYKFNEDGDTIAMEGDTKWYADLEYCKDNYDGAPDAIPSDREFPTASNE
jgi:hypothetical protein